MGSLPPEDSLWPVEANCARHCSRGCVKRERQGEEKPSGGSSACMDGAGISDPIRAPALHVDLNCRPSTSATLGFLMVDVAASPSNTSRVVTTCKKGRIGRR